MEVDPNRVAAAPLAAFSEQGWRHLGPRYDPLSGEGARINGGRFNPAGSFPVLYLYLYLYLCLSRRCAVAELQRFGARQAIGVEGLLPRYLYRYEVRLDRVLNLADDQVRTELGIGRDLVIGPDWTVCRDLGVTAHALGAQAVRSPSAAGVDDVLAVFVQHLGLGTIEPTMVEEWHSVDDLATG